MPCQYPTIRSKWGHSQPTAWTASNVRGEFSLVVVQKEFGRLWDRRSAGYCGETRSRRAEREADSVTGSRLAKPVAALAEKGAGNCAETKTDLIQMRGYASRN